MEAFPSSHEIEELIETSESKTGHSPEKKPIFPPLKNYSIEDDINKLFEAIEIGSYRKGVDRFERRGQLSKRAMKRPMGAGPSQVLGIGISESVSLKQALRGLCISQASEMAAVKKRTSRPSSSSPVISEARVIDKLRRAVAVEQSDSGQFYDKGKGSPLEISLVPERSLMEEGIVCCSMTNGDSDLAGASELSCSSSSGNKPEQRIAEKGGNSLLENERTENLAADRLSYGAIPSTFSVENQRVKSSRRGLSRQRLKTPNFIKNKVVPKTTLGPESVCLEVDSIASNSDPEKLGLEEHATSKPTDVVTEAQVKEEIPQSSKSSAGENSSTTSHSEESYLSYGSSSSGSRPHMSKNLRWDAINYVKKEHKTLSLRHFKLVKKIGGGDIGTVYLSELIGTSCLFAVKVMNKEFLASRNKIARAQTEKAILETLDHPFLPTLYAHFETKKFSCLAMEYCPNGDLHILRQKQTTKSFPEKAARFYVAEVLLALEYLHMLGVVYRDLKPENVLVREDGHIMLSDFDLSLRCNVNPTLLCSTSPDLTKKTSSCIEPFCFQPSLQLSCFAPRFFSAASKTRKQLKSELANQIIPLPTHIIVEPTNARSNSFVGTHEYLAPEIIKGEGHGSAVDWWTFGVFLYELLYGKTPFKGSSNEDTLSNVVSEKLKFPQAPMVSYHARDLMRKLLKKEPEGRLGCLRGAAEIKQHPFFEGLNWALIRCETPPDMTKLLDASKSSKPQPEEDGCRRDVVEFEMF